MNGIPVVAKFMVLSKLPPRYEEIMMGSLSSAFFNAESESYNTPEGRLLTAIIGQAIHDAGVIDKLSPKMEEFEIIEETKRKYTERSKARRWIMDKGSSFSDICSLLDIDAEHIRMALWQTTAWAKQYGYTPWAKSPNLSGDKNKTPGPLA